MVVLIPTVYKNSYENDRSNKQLNVDKSIVGHVNVDRKPSTAPLTC